MRKFSKEAFLLIAEKKRKIKPNTKNTDLEGMGPAEKRMEAQQNPFKGPQKPTDGDKKKKKKKPKY
jgi:hypothetical protein